MLAMEICKQKLLINRTLPIITTPIDPHIPDRVTTFVGTPHACTTPTTKPVIMNEVCSSARILRTPREHVSSRGRYGTTLRDRNFSIPRKGTVLIGGTTAYPTKMGIQEIVNPHGYTGSMEIRDIQILDTSIDGNLAENGDYAPIFSQLIGQDMRWQKR